MLVTARVEYACLAMLELATQHGSSKLVRLVDLAEKHGIPQRFLVQILLQMKAAGLVNTTRGASGGYQLAKLPEQITIADIFSAMSRMEEPEDRDILESPLYSSLQGVWRGLADANLRYLKDHTLRSLLPLSHDYVI